MTQEYTEIYLHYGPMYTHFRWSSNDIEINNNLYMDEKDIFLECLPTDKGRHIKIYSIWISRHKKNCRLLRK